MSIRVQILDAGGFFRRRLPLVRRAVQQAVAHVESVSDLSDVDLVVNPTDFGRDQFSIAAFTMGPHNIHIGVERSQLSSDDLETDLFRTTVHELHHAARWREIGKWTVGEALILEGLALVADHAAAGPQDLTDRPLEDVGGALDYMVANRREKLEAHRSWLYTSEPTQPGAIPRVYTVGFLLMDAATRRLGLTAWEAAKLDAETLLETAVMAVAEPARKTG